MNKFKLGHCVECTRGERKQQGVVVGVDNRIDIGLKYLVSLHEDTYHISDLEKQIKAFAGTIDFLDGFPLNQEVMWFFEDELELTSPRKDVIYTVRDIKIPNRKMIFKSSANAEGCGIREVAQLMWSDFNHSRGQFINNGKICYQDHHNDDKIVRFFYPSSQEDIDCLLSFTNGEIQHPGYEQPQDRVLSTVTNEGHNLSGKISYIKSNKENMKTITRDQLKEIHDIACPAWQERIRAIASDQPFGDVELNDGKVEEMFNAATPSQLPVLEKIFGKKNKFNVNVQENTVTRSDGTTTSIFSKERFEGVLSPSLNFKHEGYIMIGNNFKVETFYNDGMQYIKITEK